MNSFWKTLSRISIWSILLLIALGAAITNEDAQRGTLLVSALALLVAALAVGLLPPPGLRIAKGSSTDDVPVRIDMNGVPMVECRILTSGGRVIELDNDTGIGLVPYELAGTTLMVLNTEFVTLKRFVFSPVPGELLIVELDRDDES